MTTLRPWLRPRFSLRVLLLAVTAFAVGFPVWYRWPYQEAEQLTPSFFGRSPKNVEIRITTFQRQWGGQRLKHGPERLLVNGELVRETNYRGGKRHGLFFEHSFQYAPYSPTATPKVTRSAEPTTAGQYVDGMKEGTWAYGRGESAALLVWHHDQLVQPKAAD
jgi:hypothetical protein